MGLMKKISLKLLGLTKVMSRKYKGTRRNIKGHKFLHAKFDHGGKIND